MQAVYYERTGPASEVLTTGELPTSVAGPREVRVKVAWSGVNPSDVKSRAGIPDDRVCHIRALFPTATARA